MVHPLGLTVEDGYSIHFDAMDGGMWHVCFLDHSFPSLAAVNGRLTGVPCRPINC